MHNKRDEKAVVLLSGGLDSATVAAIAKDEGYDIYALTFLYGQMHSIEIESAKKIAAFLDVENHMIIELPLGSFANSSLTGVGKIPMGRNMNEISSGIPSTYVPGRNIIFLSYAVSYAESIGANNVFIGVNSIDFSGYPDCRQEFIDAFQKAVDTGTKAGVEGKKGIRIRAPLINLSKREIIEKGLSLNLDYSLTHSCYSPKENGMPCGKCDSCIIRSNAFKEIGIDDPLIMLFS
ncbi:MAG: 7-cyano-7-deazaguanine synthase QueC [Candidatus Schekmanbacteria bacterium]|nr:MAG: 7-cyano-7-deazaguanine synthase QueC [Candidatus Schekmanbacteria bacterium]